MSRSFVGGSGVGVGTLVRCTPTWSVTQSSLIKSVVEVRNSLMYTFVVLVTDQFLFLWQKEWEESKDTLVVKYA